MCRFHFCLSYFFFLPLACLWCLALITSTLIILLLSLGLSSNRLLLEPIFFIILAFSVFFFSTKFSVTLNPILTILLSYRTTFPTISKLFASIICNYFTSPYLHVRIILKIVLLIFSPTIFSCVFFYLIAYICKISFSSSIYSSQLTNANFSNEILTEMIWIHLSFFIFDVFWSESTKHWYSSKWFITLEDNCDSILGSWPSIIFLSPWVHICFYTFCTWHFIMKKMDMFKNLVRCKSNKLPFIVTTYNYGVIIEVLRSILFSTQQNLNVNMKYSFFYTWFYNIWRENMVI